MIERRPAPLLATAAADASRRVEGTLKILDGRFPYYTENGRWITTENGGWTGGQWVGQLWIAYQLTGEDGLRRAALSYLPRLKARIQHHEADFDLGFLLYPSFVRGYELLGDLPLRQTALKGARRMLDFFHQKAGLFYTFYPDRCARLGRKVGTSIVDVMMNLQLLWWAAAETGDSELHDAAATHSRRSADLFVRNNGSTFHAVDFDLDTGRVLHRGTIHGNGDASTWARGQAWAVHGFADAHRATGDPLFLSVAERLARRFWKCLPRDGRSYWDLDKGVGSVRDASASAIAAVGYLKLPSPWPNRGRALVKRLLASAPAVTDAQGLLQGATAYKTRDEGIEGATVWGDYYLIEALLMGIRAGKGSNIHPNFSAAVIPS